MEQIPYPRQETRLPEVLSFEEVSKLFSCVETAVSRMILQTMYGAGLRLMEAVSLKKSDIDSERMVIRVRQGKGRRDRYVTLSATLLDTLREYYKSSRPKGEWLFANRKGTGAIDHSAVQRACSLAARKAGLRKRVTTHTMRHSFATSLLEEGVDLRTIQILLGHRSLNTTAIYLHVAVGAKQSGHKMVDLLELSKKFLRTTEEERADIGRKWPMSSESDGAAFLQSLPALERAVSRFQGALQECRTRLWARTASVATSAVTMVTVYCSCRNRALSEVSGSGSSGLA